MASDFKKAFAAARKAGKKEFSFNGKQYNTELKETARPKARPAASKEVTPKPRPSVKESNNNKVSAAIKSGNDAVLAAKARTKASPNTNPASRDKVKSAMAKAAGSRYNKGGMIKKDC